MEARARRPWQQKEDEILWEALKDCGEQDNINWNEIAKHLEGRNNKDCRKRWVYTLCPSVTKGSWTEEEDLHLIKGIEIYGPNWPKVSQVVQTRQADQCSRRWLESLNPEIHHGKWSIDEDAILKNAVKAHGRKWTEIARTYFQHRTPLSIRNRHSQLHRQWIKHSSGLGSSQKEQNLEIPRILGNTASFDSSFQGTNLAFSEYSRHLLDENCNFGETYNGQDALDDSYQELSYTTEPVTISDQHQEWADPLPYCPLETLCETWNSAASEMWHFSFHAGINTEEVSGTQHHSHTSIDEQSIPALQSLGSTDHTYNSDARDWAALDMPQFSDLTIPSDGLVSDWGTFGVVENLDSMYALRNDIAYTLRDGEHRNDFI